MKRPPKNGRERERQKRPGQGGGCTWGDRRKLETFQSRVDWNGPRTPEAASVAPIGKPENLRVWF